MKVFITGANGYLGGHLQEVLRQRSHVAYCVDSHMRPLGTSMPWSWQDWIKKADAVVHLAWFSSAGSAHPEIQGECFDLTCEVLRKSPDKQPFVFASTASVYGDRGDSLCTETTPHLPNCSYTKSKCEAEQLIRSIKPNHHTIYRFGSMMGRGVGRTKTDVVVNSFAVDGWIRKRIEVWNPSAWKPVIHVRDAAEVIVEGLEKNWRGTINSTYKSMRASEIADMASRMTGAGIVEVGDRSGPRSCRIDSSFLFRLRDKELSHRTVEQAILEFKDFQESPADKNSPERYHQK